MKKQKIIPFNINHQPSGGREWVALIAGIHPKYNFSREFLAIAERNWSSSGKTGYSTFFLEEGKIYEYSEPWGARNFIEVANGNINIISAEEVMEKITK